MEGDLDIGIKLESADSTTQNDGESEQEKQTEVAADHSAAARDYGAIDADDDNGNHDEEQAPKSFPQKVS